MKVQLIEVGKTSKSYLIEGEKEYVRRIQRYISFERITLPDIKNRKNLSEKAIKKKEADKILEKIQQGDFVILLDEIGKEYSSVGFSKFLQKQFHGTFKRILFIVGGAYGFDDKIYQRSNHKMALSQLTFSHQMVRLFFLEQLYRALTIQKGEPYHHQ